MGATYIFVPPACHHTTEIIMLSDISVLIKVSSSIPLMRQKRTEIKIMQLIYAINIIICSNANHTNICPKPAFDMGITCILTPVSYITHSRCSMMYTYYKCKRICYLSGNIYMYMPTCTIIFLTCNLWHDI